MIIGVILMHRYQIVFQKIIFMIEKMKKLKNALLKIPNIITILPMEKNTVSNLNIIVLLLTLI